MVLATLKLILLVDVFDQDFTLLGWSYTTSTLTIQSSMARTNKDIDDHLKTSSLLWTFEVESLFGVALWEIKLNLCDAVGDDRGDDGDVHDIDDDDKQVAPAVWRRGEEGTVCRTGRLVLMYRSWRKDLRHTLHTSDTSRDPKPFIVCNTLCFESISTHDCPTQINQHRQHLA